MWRHYVYIHRKASDGTPFYVGKGVSRIREKRQHYERSRAAISRSQHWERIVAKHGLVIDLVMSCQTDAEAQSQEMRLIADIGRSDLGNGPLVNRTDGGDGHAGVIVSEELRRKRRVNSSGKRSPAFIAACRAARKNGGNGGVVKRGDKLPASWVANIAAAKVGDKNPRFGKPSPASKKVRNIVTGTVYDSITRAAAAEGVSVKALYQWLDGSRLNRSPLVRVGDGMLV